MRSLTDSELMATNSFHSNWNVFDHTGKVVGQLHGITRGYGEAVMYIKYRGDVTASKGVTYKGKWPKDTFEVSETGSREAEAFAQKKLMYFRQLARSDARRRPKRDPARPVDLKRKRNPKRHGERVPSPGMRDWQENLKLAEALQRAEALEFDLIGRYAVIPDEDPHFRWLEGIPTSSLKAVVNAYEKAGYPANRYRALIQRRRVK